MGGSPIDSGEMRSYYTTNSHISRARSASEVFTSKRMFGDFDPAKMKLPREACDSAASPHSRGIIYAEDVTGSMGRFLLSLIKEEFPRLIKKTYDTVSFDPHIMFMGVGDVAAGDEAPLQVTQFETDLRMLDQLQKIWLEECGGGNGSESYILPWYFASRHIRMDCWEKRKEKGFLFTFGDDGPTPKLTKRDVDRVFGGRSSLEASMLTPEDCLERASEKFYCYHIILRGGAYDSYVVREWRKLMGSHVCDLSDHKYLPELVTTILAMYEGLTKTEALNKIESSEARRVVEEALKWHEEEISDLNEISEDSEPQLDLF